MVRVFIVAILMLCVAALLTAQTEGISIEEYSRRANELNRLAEQIKQETGFEGRIDVTPEANRISHFRGKFTDIRVPAIDDTLGFERVFDEMRDRVLPYFPVNRRDLTKEPMRISKVSVSQHYKQTANGYDFQSSPRLIIYYLPDQDMFVINNGLAYLDPAELPAKPRITKEEAIRIFFENVEVSDRLLRDARNQLKFRLQYCYEREIPGTLSREASPLRYRLAWYGGGYSHTFIVDAITGEIMASGIFSIIDHN